MKIISNLRFSLILAILVLSSAYGVNSKGLTESTPDTQFPEYRGWVNDFDGILNKKEEKTLAAKIVQHKKRFGDQIAIVTLKDIQSYQNLESYSLDLANFWGVGETGKNNGILIAVCPSCREVYIQNGDGVMQRLSNEETREIIDSQMLPEFKSQNYYTGINKGLDAIIAELVEKTNIR